MAAKDRISKATEAARTAQRNRYLQRLVSDEELRGTLMQAYGAARNAYGRMANGKPPSKAILEDRKLQRELKEAANALRGHGIRPGNHVTHFPAGWHKPGAPGGRGAMAKEILCGFGVDVDER